MKNEKQKQTVKHICVVGAGLMGGSLALALRPFIPHLTLVDNNPSTREAVAGLADNVTADFGEGVRHAQAVILAVPVGGILRLLTELPKARPEGCLVLDLGSTKQAICAAMEELPPQFEAVGGHPMCGKEVSGFAAAEAGLFQDKPFILCRTTHTTPQAEQWATDLVAQIGAQVHWLEAAEHDRLVGTISHLPYLVSALLMDVAAQNDHSALWQISASGFRDTARLAGSDPKMMAGILRTNREVVLNGLKQYAEALTAVARLLENNDETALRVWLNEVQQAYQAYRAQK